jgi:hypothetical protein
MTPATHNMISVTTVSDYLLIVTQAWLLEAEHSPSESALPAL